MKMTSDQLKAMGLTQNPDGTYSKKQHQETVKKEKIETKPEDIIQPKGYRSIEIVLRGIPMPKQSVRQGKNKLGQTVFYQPKEMKMRVLDYQMQIKQQLPKGWQMFKNLVHVRSAHYIFPALKGFSKGIMNDINQGKFIWKTTKPDIIDNLKKLPFDAMSGIVYKDDSIIVSENDIRKVYGAAPYIIIKLEGF